MENNYINIIKNKIVLVEKDSIAEELEIEIGDRLIAINGKEVNDIIDYLYLLADEYVEVEIEKKNKEIWVLEIEKEFYEELGIEFENPIMDKAKTCSNKCVFCFVDQLPTGMRDTLYFKDDDSRLSFLQGNFVTLTNLKQRDLDRIVEYQISPLNVSIHATNPKVRKRMLGNKFAGEIFEKLEFLIKNNIDVNGQIVLCPGYNDKEELDRTLTDLFKLAPQFHSVAIVPVGITKYREKLAKLTLFNKESSNDTIDQVELLQKKFKEDKGIRFSFLSDEFYVTAEREFPAYDDYEGFIQLENGVGLMRKFEKELELAILESNVEKDVCGNPITILTGISAYKFINEMVEKIQKVYSNIKVDVIQIDNDFFGRTITVAGLITATDIIAQVKNKRLSKYVMIPEVMLRTNEEVFLDDLTLDDLKREIEREVIVTKVQGISFLDHIIRRKIDV